MSIYLITGASSGLGRQLAEAALNRGHSVAAAAQAELDLWRPLGECIGFSDTPARGIGG